MAFSIEKRAAKPRSVLSGKACFVLFKSDIASF